MHSVRSTEYILQSADYYCILRDSRIVFGRRQKFHLRWNTATEMSSTYSQEFKTTGKCNIYLHRYTGLAKETM